MGIEKFNAIPELTLWDGGGVRVKRYTKDDTVCFYNADESVCLRLNRELAVIIADRIIALCTEQSAQGE
jgi:hypothetical protein